MVLRAKPREQLAGREEIRHKRTIVLTRSARHAALGLLCSEIGTGSRQGCSKKQVGSDAESPKKGEKNKAQSPRISVRCQPWPVLLTRERVCCLSQK